MFEHIGILATAGPQVNETLHNLAEHLASHSIRATIDIDVAGLADNPNLTTATAEQLAHDCDLIIVVGGDGTMLTAARKMAGHNVPLLGINLGHLGFLTDISPASLAGSLAPVLQGEFVQEERFLLHATVQRDGETLETLSALNDIVIQKNNAARLIAFETWVNAAFVHSQRSDGLIVSTPTGSTAYAMSGGGPIMHPSLNAIAIVPICPHTLSQRPIVIDGNSRIEIIVQAGQYDRAQLSGDGEEMTELLPGDRVIISKSDKRIQLLHPADHDHFATLRAKLHWGREL